MKSRSNRPTAKEIGIARDQNRVLPHDRPNEKIYSVGELIDGTFKPPDNHFIGKDVKGNNVFSESAGEALIDYSPKVVINEWEFYHTIMHDEDRNRSSYLAISHQKNKRKGDVPVLPCKPAVFAAIGELDNIVNPFNGQKVLGHRQWLHEFIILSLYKNGFEYDIPTHGWKRIKAKYMSLFYALQKLPETLAGMSSNIIGKTKVVTYDPLQTALDIGVIDKDA